MFSNLSDPSSTLTLVKGSKFHGIDINDENIKLLTEFFEAKGGKSSVNADGNVEISATRNWLYQTQNISFTPDEITAFFAAKRPQKSRLEGMTTYLKNSVMPAAAVARPRPSLAFMYQNALFQQAYDKRFSIALAGTSFAAGAVAGAMGMKYKLRA